MTAVSTKTANPRKLIEGSRTISRPGSAVVVKELLLTPEGRAHLPLRRLFLLYLDPFAYFMDASLGPAWRRRRP